jgi:hypothetical protein
VATLSPDVVVHGPAVRRSLVGRADVICPLEAMFATFQAFTQEFRDGPHTAPVFEARIGDRVVQGVSPLEDDEHGRIKTITVIRPLLRLTARGDTTRSFASVSTPPVATTSAPARAAAGRPPAPG